MSDSKLDSKIVVVDKGEAIRCNFNGHHLLCYPPLSDVAGVAQFVTEVLKADRIDERDKLKYIIVRAGTAADGHGTPYYQVFERHTDWVIETWEPYKGDIDNDPVSLGKARIRLSEIMLSEE